MSRAILDTSVLIAREQERPLGRPLPQDVAVSVISIAELEIGVMVARDAKTRGQRLRTLTEVRSLTGALPIDERTASAYAQLAASVLAEGRKPRIHDTWIAATALVYDAEIWTQDTDFSEFAEAVPVIRV
ncbi:MAG TPA: PIN domain-containing protein [Solirubrobacteraceae bacterium]|nr:PIN domain-containing protein [Solirubrobacteraceae bacterium]